MTDDIFKPENLREAESVGCMMEIENMLLERLLTRREMKIEQLEKRLNELSIDLNKAEQKIEGYESLIGLRQFQKISFACQQWAKYFTETSPELGEGGTNTQSGGSLSVTRSLIGRIVTGPNSLGGGELTISQNTLIWNPARQTSGAEIISKNSSDITRLDHGVWLAILLAIVPEWLNIFLG